LLGLGCVVTFAGAARGGGLVGALFVGALLVRGALVGAALTGALADGDASAPEAAADAGLDRGAKACAAPILSACGSARALVHAATTATTSAVTTPRRAPLDLRRDVEEAKRFLPHQDLGERAATTTVRAMKRLRHSTRDFFLVSRYF
jgi:hypothetical protein